MHDDDMDRTALKVLLDQRSAGAFVSGAQMDKKAIARVISDNRHAQGHSSYPD